MKNTLLVLADAAAVTSDGKLIIHGIFDQLRAAKLPAVHPSMTIVFQVKEAPASMTYALRMRDVMNEKSVYEFAMPPNADSTRGGKVGGIVQVNGLKFETYGAYTVSLLANGEVVGTTTFTLSPVT